MKASSTITQQLIAIGDLHGHYPALERLLDRLDKDLGIFDLREPDRLRRGVKMVFTGDYIDRGDRALELIERLQRLVRTNPGRVITLMGNHEAMALQDYDDAKELLTSTPAPGRDRVLEYYEMDTLHGGNGGLAFIREFGTDDYDALARYVTRMAREGDIGGWMRRLQPCFVATVAGRRILLMHAGLPVALRNRQTLERYLKRVAEHVEASTFSLGGSRAKWGSPGFQRFFWDRWYRTLDSDEPEEIQDLCRDVGVNYIVTGHTPHDSITVYGDRIFDIDVGMTPAYGEGVPQALVIDSGGISSIRADGGRTEFERF